MNTEDKEDETIQRVAVNHDEQLSIDDPLIQENALVWREMGKSAPGEATRITSRKFGQG